MKRTLLLFSAIILISFNFSKINAQHNIKISMPEFAGDSLYFGHYFRESMIIKDTALLDSKGNGVFEGKELLPGGLYLVYLPDKKRFDILIDSIDQDFSISSDTANLTEDTKISGNKENELFYSYQRYIADKRKEAESLQKRISKPASAADSVKAKEDLDKMNKSVASYVAKLVKDNPNTFLSTFLLSMKDVEVPDPPKDKNGKVTDPTFQYRYYKDHYFDNFDLSDVRLLRTPFYEKKLKYYLDHLVIPDPDSVYKEVDFLIQKSRTDTFLFKYMLTTLFNYYAQSKYIGMDAVYAYIAQKYYIPEATWADPKFITDLKDRVKKIIPLEIGKIAPDIKMVDVSDEHFKAAATDTAMRKNPYVGNFFQLKDVAGDFLILYFWEADCGHCQKAIPVLHDVYERLRKQGINVQVVAVHMLSGIEGKEKWVDFVNEHKLYGWINAWNPYDFSYRDTYDVTASNIIYLLDKNKKIIAKHTDPEQTEKIILNEIKNDKK